MKNLFKKGIIICIFLLITLILFSLLYLLFLFLVNNIGTEYIKGYALVSLIGGLLLLYLIVKYGFSLLKGVLILPMKILFLNEKKNTDKILKVRLENMNIKSIFEIIKYIYFVYKVTQNPNFEVKNEELIFWKTPKKYHSRIRKINTLLEYKVGKKHYITNFTVNKDIFQIAVNKGNETNKELTSKILQYKEEIYTYFKNPDFIPNIDFSHTSDIFYIQIHNVQSLWENQTLDLHSLKLKKGELLCGFFPTLKNEVKNRDYMLQTKDLFHSFVAGATRSGKDVFIRNIFVSILYQIKCFQNMNLYFFDTKGNDGVFLEHLQSYGIERYTKIEEYTQKFQELVQEMKKTQEKVGKYGNIYEYNASSGKEKIKENIIIVNEFLSLTRRLDLKILNELLGYITTLTSEGAGAGYKLIFMSQTARKDGNPKIAEILVNVKTKFALKVNNLEESFILSRGLSENEKHKVAHIPLHNTFHIEDNAIQREFKAYYLSQQDLIDWIDKNFEKQQEFKSKKINDYLRYSKENDEISMKVATEKFGLTRTDWNTFIQYLEKNNLISRLENNKIIWRKEIKSK